MNKTVLLTIVIITSFIIPAFGDAPDEFIRGVWIAYYDTPHEIPNYFKCVPGYETGWTADDINWQRERELLEDLNVNLIFEEMQFEHFWMDSVCKWSGGAIKTYVNIDSPYYYDKKTDPPGERWLADSLNLTFWTNCDTLVWGQGCEHYTWDEYPGSAYKNGFLKALTYWDTVYTDTSTAVLGFHLGHEFNRYTDSPAIKGKKYSLYNFMTTAVHDSTDRICAILGDGYGTQLQFEPNFIDSVQNLDVYQFDRYPYLWDYDGYNYSFTGIAISGYEFQELLDTLLFQMYDSLFILLNDEITWTSVIQTHASFRGDDFLSCNSSDSNWHWDTGNISYSGERRMPSREEIRLQAFLSISRGANGILSYVYGPSMYTSSDYGAQIGLLNYNEGSNYDREEWFPRDDVALGGKMFNYSTGESPYEYMRLLNNELEIIGPIVVNLLTEEIGSYGGFDSLRWVDGNSSDWAIQLYDTTTQSDTAVHFWELTTFIDTSTVDSTDYFMLVNRMTCPNSVENDTSDWIEASPREIALLFTQPSGYYPFVQNIHTGDATFITSYDSLAGGKYWFTFADTVDPGNGEIYRVTSAFSGPITDSVIVSHDIILTEDLVVDTGGALTFKPGVTVFVYPDYDGNNQGYSDSTIEIITKGKIYANGTSSDSIIFVPFTASPGKGDWVGIYIDDDTYGEFSYCSIQYGDRGIEMRSDAEVLVANSNISNHSSMGIYNYKGNLNLKNSVASGNDDYGLSAYQAIDTVQNTTFHGNGSYGIKIDGTNPSNDESYLLSNTITQSSGEDGSQYGIYVKDNDYTKIDLCTVNYYDQGGIKLDNSDAEILRSTFENVEIYGIYSSGSGFPTVIYCTFDTLDIGVKAVLPSIPDLGDTSATDGDNSFLKCDDYFVHFSGFQGGVQYDSLFAQMNWWGSSSPNPRKFYHSPPNIVIVYSPYRTSAPPKITFDNPLPLEFTLNQNYPNPFNVNTTISFSLDMPARTTVTIFNILGQRVATPVNEYMGVGSHSVIWDGRNSSGSAVASGVYFYTIQSGDHFDSKKMLLLR